MMNFNLFSTPIFLLILFDILLICFFQLKCLVIVSPRKLNSSTQQILSLSIKSSGITVFLGGL